jgi:hypothetical protein
MNGHKNSFADKLIIGKGEGYVQSYLGKEILTKLIQEDSLITNNSFSMAKLSEGKFSGRDLK